MILTSLGPVRFFSYSPPPPPENWGVGEEAYCGRVGWVWTGTANPILFCCEHHFLGGLDEVLWTGPVNPILLRCADRFLGGLDNHFNGGPRRGAAKLSRTLS